MPTVKVALAAGLLAIAAAVALVLSSSPQAVLATNGVAASETLAAANAGTSACQPDELLPRGTTAIRLSLGAFTGPELTVEARSGAEVVAVGRHGAGWDGQTVTVPVRRVSHTIAPVRICFAISPLLAERASVNGSPAPPGRAVRSSGGDVLSGRMRVEYLGAGRLSWLSRAGSVARRMGLGRAWSGSWVALLVAVLMLLAIAVCSRQILGELGDNATAESSRRISGPAWTCALVACLSAVSWSFISPPFQVPDEPDHFAYVKQLAETGTLPKSSAEAYSREELLVLLSLRYLQVRQHPGNRTIASEAQQRQLAATLALVARLPRTGSRAAGVATSEPPLYYALEAIPYSAASSGTLLDRLQLMRLLSALWAAITALFTFLFLRETLPRWRWAWSVGALGVGLSPLLGFMAGAVNPDGMLFAVSAALFYCFARAFRRGLATPSAIALGLVLAIGLLTKLNFVGLLPGALLALAILAARGARRFGRGALRAPAIAIAIACVPVVLFVLRNALAGHATFGIAADTVRATHGSLLAEVRYIWQLYLPRLPGMGNDFPGLSTTRQVWFDGYVGRFGWLDTFFPGWVYTVALAAAVLIAVACARTLLARRGALRGRLAELAVYTFIAFGLLVLIGADSYRAFPGQSASYGQARYLLALLPLLGLVLALAARGAGRRWGPVAGTLIVMLFLAHDLFSQLQVIARYYG
jgi:hypothetical protein